MGSFILRVATRMLVGLILVFSVYLLFRGHNAPGGGFAAALVAGTGFALFAITEGPRSVRRALRVDPQVFIAWGLLLAVLAMALLMLRDLPVTDYIRRLVLLSVAAVGVVQLALFPPARPAYDLREASELIARAQADGRPAASIGRYHGQFQFYGRLRQRVAPLAISPTRALVGGTGLALIEDLGDVTFAAALAGMIGLIWIFSAKLGFEKGLIVLGDANDNVYLASRNIPGVYTIDVAGIDPVSLVGSDKVVLTVDAVEKIQEWLG
mgnify:CR=1 FL=1